MNKEHLKKTLTGIKAKDLVNLSRTVEKEAAGNAEYVAPRNTTEQELLDIWSKLLNREGLGIRHDFFRSGGNSIKATQLVSRIARHFGADLKLTDIFRHATVEKLSALLGHREKIVMKGIPRLPGQEHYAVSHAQRRLWFINQFSGGAAAYQIPVAGILKGAINKPAFYKAFELLLARHESLRTAFIEIDGEPRQKILPPPPASAFLQEYDAGSGTVNGQTAEQLATAFMKAPFDLDGGLPLRAALIQQAAGQHLFVCVIHHLVCDGSSMEILMRELTLAYNAFCQDQPDLLPALPVQYRDFAAWQQEQLLGENSSAQRSYWLQQFEGDIPVLELPADFPRPAMKLYKGDVHTLQVPDDVYQLLRSLVARSEASLFMVLQATLYALFYRYTGQEDIILGTVTAGRDHGDLEEQVGLYANTLALRTRFSGEDTFDALLKAVSHTTLQAFEHQRYPFDHLVGELKLARSLNRSPLFDVMMVLHNNRTATAGDFAFNGVAFESYPLPAAFSKFDLTFNFREVNNSLLLSIEYDTALFTPAYIARMALHWQTLVRALPRASERSLYELDYLPEQERDTLLYRFNDTAAPATPATVHALVEAQALRMPAATALIAADGTLAYEELNAKANRFAHYLRNSAGVQPQDRVGILLDRSVDMLVVMLGIMKAGAAYVPLDASYPVDRIAYIAESSRMQLLVTQRARQAIYGQLPVTALCLEDMGPALPQQLDSNPQPAADAECSMYVLYTSGSTGLPKGVEISHRAAANLLRSMQREPGITAGDVLLAITTYAFDISVLELFLPLITGAVVRLASMEESRDPAALAAILDAGGCTMMQATPSMWRMLVEEGWQGAAGLKLLCGGERLSPELAAALLKRCNSLYNVYGPTETTVWSAVKKITAADPVITIGRPIANTRLYVLDPQQAPVATLVYGELYIGGEGLAKGYLFRPELTEERFVPDPFIPGTKMYRTGDVARWLPCGEMEVAGRLDEQVKIRGFRIEPAEIETALLKYTPAREAVVVADTSAGEAVLVAYVVSDAPAAASVMRDSLRKALPEYMLPAYIVSLPALPLTPNGKVNRKALPAAVQIQEQLQVDDVAPRSAREQAMAAIWAEVLGIQRIGVNDNFFQLGGHSLKATQVVARVRGQMGLHLRLQDVFIHPTIAGLCHMLQEGDGGDAWTIAPAPQQDSYPLSDAQRRLWILQQWEQTASAYHMSNAFYLKGRLEVEALNRAFKALLERHESLRTRFRVINGEPRQVITAPENSAFRLHYEDLRSSAVKEQEIQARVTAQAHELFDLQQGPLIRAALLQATGTDYVFVLTMHHIISDGWSMGVMVREVLSLYEAFRNGQPDPFSPLDIQYKDYTLWQQSRLAAENVEAARSYWLQRFQDSVPVLELPLDRPRPAVKSYRGGAVKFTIDAAQVKALETVARQQEATLFMALLAATYALLYRYTGQEDIVIGSPVAGREHAALENQIGFYVNTLALRTCFNGSRSFRELLNDTRATALEAYQHQLYPFDQLVDDLELERVMNRHPLFDVMVVLQNTHLDSRPLPALEELEISGFPMEHRVSKFDWWLSFSQRENGLAAVVEYDTALFTQESMLQVATHFQSLLAALVEHPEQAIDSLQYITTEEKNRLLYQFNDTAHDFMQHATLVSLFERAASRHPGHTALVAEDSTYTYQSLNEAANRLAHYLRNGLQVKPDEPVGLFLDRSPDMVISMLGILKAGGAYVPIDPAYPESRISYIVADSGLRVLITGMQQQTVASRLDCDKIYLEAAAGQLADWPATNPGSATTPRNLAYIIYTSGSTGQPKGCELEHRSIVNRIQWMWEHYGFTAADCILQKTAYVFDVSVWEFFMTLCFGARLVLCRREQAYAPQALMDMIAREGVTTLHFVPSMFDAFLTALEQEAVSNMPSLRRIITSGEALSLESVQRHYRLLPQVQLHNLYGPTEAAVDVTSFATAPDTGKVLIGRPIWNTGVYILDGNGALVPPGVYGEIHLGGVGLARGYRNKPALTAEKFVPHPFINGERLYKTGDTGRFLADGQIEYAGRNDDQVKIRGYRIEPGEVAAAILKHPAVSQAAVLAWGGSGEEKSLAAYLVCRPGALELLQSADQMQTERVAEWRSVFEHTYREGTDDDAAPMFNIKGWNNSYTGQPIPAGEMKAWVDDIVGAVLHYQPQDVLEIGCGTGLLLFRIAPHTRRYVGTEISATAIEYLTACISSAPAQWSQVTLLQQAADQLDSHTEASYDMVLINSVVQYFPDADYLTSTIAAAMRLIRPGGRLVIGDVRSLPLAATFHATVTHSKMDAAATAAGLPEQWRTALDNEKELLIDPAYFIALQQQQHRIGLVEILPKNGDYENELSRFRYQVVLHLSPAVTELPPLTWLDAGTGHTTLDKIRDHLLAEQPAYIGIAGVPNSRLRECNRLMQAIAAAAPTDTVAALSDKLQQPAPALTDEKAVLQLAAGLGYSAYIGWGRQQREGSYDIILASPACTNRQLPAMLYNRLLRSCLDTAHAGAHTNNPVSQQLKDKVVPALKEFLKSMVPEYMIPTYFTLLDKFPLTTNGKLDRSALPSPVAARMVAGTAYVAPRTTTEQQLAAIWQQVLKLDTIGMHDNFFELGGHSLKATQVVSRMHQQLGVKLDLRTLFSLPTIAGLAAALEGREGEAFEMIPVAPEQSSYPLSHAQRRLWVLDQWEEIAGAYNMSSAYTLEGQLDIAALQQAFTWLVQRHESLRTRFIKIAGLPRQVVIPPAEADSRLQYVTLHPAAAEDEIKALARRHAAQRFNLEQGPLISIMLLKVTPSRHVLALNMHHIISDGWSMEVLVRELITLYASRQSLPPLRIHYKDYTLWQQQQLSDEASRRHRTYWLQRFQGIIPVLELPLDHTRPPVKTYQGNNLRFVLDAAASAGLQQVAQAAGASTFMTLLGVVSTLLYRYTGQEDIVIGSPIAGRYHPDLEDQVGFYVNTLALRTRFRGDASFSQLLDIIKTDTLDAYEHQVYPFDSLVEELQLARDTSRSPLFDVMVVLQNTGDVAQPLPAVDGLSVRPYPLGSAGISKVDLTFYFHEMPGGLSVNIEYNTSLFAPERIQRMFDHFAGICHAVAASSHVPLWQLDYLPPAEKEKLLITFNSNRLTYPSHATIQQLVEAQALRTPHQTALIAGTEVLSYEALNARANRLAHYLAVNGVVEAGALTGLMTARNAWMVVSMLAVLKAGGAYVPVDPAYPGMRIQHILQDAGAKLLLTTDRELAEPYMQDNMQLVELNEALLEELSAYPATNPLSAAAPESRAYCIYTSGSTGQPKGIQLSHRNVVAFISWALQEFANDEFDTVFATTSYCFDLSVFEIFYTLCTGKHIRLLQSGADIIHHLDKAEKILLNTVPAVIDSLLAANADFSRVNVINVAGEPVPLHFRQRLDYRRMALRNLYGPSEDTTYSSCYRFTADHESIPIGKPIANTQFYLLDPHLQLLPEGITGEICIAGDGLGMGYLHQPALNAQQFVPHPFVTGGRIYRTGDLGRWLPDGNMEYMGRLDFQVKVNGFRIEPGEVEAALSKYAGVKHNIVVARKDSSGRQRLIAYVQPDENAALEIAALQAYLRSCLPAFMVPAAFIIMEQFPLNANGKIDRGRLPLPEDNTDNAGAYTAPRNETEQLLAAAWEKALGKQRVGIYDNYFDLGGDSIRAIQVISRLHSERRSLKMSDIFQYPTIAALAPRVQITGSLADQGAVTGPAPFTPIQQEFLAGATGAARHHYNQAVMLYAAGGFDTAAIKAVFAKILEHHDALRIVLVPGERGSYQQLHMPAATLHLEEHTLSGEELPQLAVLADALHAGMDLEQGPLIRLALFRLPDGDRLLITAHHMVIDGVSWRILFEDMQLLYSQYQQQQPLTLPYKTDAFKVWAEQLHRYAGTAAALAERQYWQEADAAVVPALPAKGVPADNLVKYKEKVSFRLSPEQTSQLLTQVNAAFNSEINDILLVALLQAIYRTYGFTSAAIALEGHGREEILPGIDVSRTVGWFTAIYPVVFTWDAAIELSRHIKEVKERLRSIPNKGIGYGILKHLSADAGTERLGRLHPQISFNYLGQFDADMQESFFTIAPEGAGALQAPEAVRPHEWEVSGITAGGCLTMSVTFSSKQYDTPGMQQFMQHYREALQEVMALCLSRETTELTPSDFTYKGLSIDAIDNLFD